MQDNLDKPGPEERVCYNCKHMLWMVGIGQGVRCGWNMSANKKLPMIPYLRHTCKHFQFKYEQPESEGAATPA